MGSIPRFIAINDANRSINKKSFVCVQAGSDRLQARAIPDRVYKAFGESPLMNFPAFDATIGTHALLGD